MLLDSPLESDRPLQCDAWFDKIDTNFLQRPRLFGRSFYPSALSYNPRILLVLGYLKIARRSKCADDSAGTAFHLRPLFPDRKDYLRANVLRKRHPPREFPRAIKLRERREAEKSDFSNHSCWVCSELPNKFLHPGVADAKCSRPRTSGGPAVAGGEP